MHTPADPSERRVDLLHRAGPLQGSGIVRAAGTVLALVVFAVTGAPAASASVGGPSNPGSWPERPLSLEYLKLEPAPCPPGNVISTVGCVPGPVAPPHSQFIPDKTLVLPPPSPQPPSPPPKIADVPPPGQDPGGGGANPGGGGANPGSTNRIPPFTWDPPPPSGDQPPLIPPPPIGDPPPPPIGDPPPPPKVTAPQPPKIGPPPPPNVMVPPPPPNVTVPEPPKVTVPEPPKLAIPQPSAAPAPAVLELSDSVIDPGGGVTATGRGCAPDGPVDLSIGQVPVGQTVAGPRGGFEAELATGAADVGRHQVTAQCGRTLSAPLDVVLVNRVGTGTSTVTIILIFLLIGGWFYGHRLASHVSVRRPHED